MQRRRLTPHRAAQVSRRFAQVRVAQVGAAQVRIVRFRTGASRRSKRRAAPAGQRQVRAAGRAFSRRSASPTRP